MLYFRFPLSHVRNNCSGCRRDSDSMAKPYATPDHVDVDAKFDKPESWPLCHQPFKGQGVFRHCKEGSATSAQETDGKK